MWRPLPSLTGTIGAAVLALGAAADLHDWVPARARASRVACGPAAASVVLCYHGIRVPEASLDALVRADGTTTFADLCRLFQSEGLDPIAVRCGPEDLRELRGVAVLQLLVPDVAGERGASRPQFVVAIGNGSEGLRIVDSRLPKETWGRLETEATLRLWGGNALVVRREGMSGGWILTGTGAALAALGGLTAGRRLGRWIGMRPRELRAARA